MEEETDLVPRPPHRKSMNIQSKSKKRKANDVDLRNSAYFKICGIVGQLRPQFMEVLRTPDFRNCQAAHEIRKRMLLMMDLYKHMQIEGRQPEVSAYLNGLQPQPQQEKLADKKVSSVPISSDDDLRPQGTYIVGASVSGWNFITFINRRPPVYYGVTKESFRLCHELSVEK